MDIKTTELWSYFKNLTIEENFPVDECTVKTKEKGVYEGTKSYICIIDFGDGSYKLMEMKPYIWKASDMDNLEGYPADINDILFGWISVENHNDYYDNYVNNIHDDSLCDGLVLGYIA